LGGFVSLREVPVNVKLAASDVGPFILVIVVFWVLTAIVHVAFAFAVAVDSSAHVSSGRGTVFVGRFVWVVATLFGGPFVALAYWAMHYWRPEPAQSNVPMPTPVSPNARGPRRRHAVSFDHRPDERHRPGQEEGAGEPPREAPPPGAPGPEEERDRGDAPSGDAES
jgi:hypothetical protein